MAQFWFLAIPILLVAIAGFVGLFVWGTDVVFLLLLHVTVGLIFSCLLHEVSHVFFLLRIPEIKKVTFEITLFRISVRPCGNMTRGQAILVALSGPGICFLCGVGLCFIYRDLSWWYLIHIMSLLPIFGDGRAIITALFAQ